MNKKNEETENVESADDEVRRLRQEIKVVHAEVTKLEGDINHLRASLEQSKEAKESMGRRLKATRVEAEEKLKGSVKVATVLKEALKKLDASEVNIPITAAKSLVKLDNDIEKLSTIETK